MTKTLNKVFVLAIFLILCLSVSYATNVTDDTTTDSVDTSVTAAETPSMEKESNLAKQTVKQKSDNSKKQEKREINEFIFENTTLDITSNNFDNSVVTLLDNVNVYSSNNMQLSNTAFNVMGNNVNITGLRFYNWDYDPIVIKVTNSSNVNLINNNINLTSIQAIETKGVNIKNSVNVSVLGNNINLSGVPQSAGWDNSSGEWVENMKVSGIKAEESSSIIINDNIVTITNSTTWGEVNSSTDAISLKTCNDSQVENNTVSIEGSDYIYGIATSRFNNNLTIFNNYITLTGKNYICGIQFASTSNSRIKQNYVSGTCTAVSGQCPSYEAFAYGIIDLTGTYGANTSEAIGNIIELNHVTLHSTIVYAYELSNTENTQLLNNFATIFGNVVMGLGVFNSSYCGIYDNIFEIYGNTTTLNSSIYDAVRPVTTGIKINETSYYNNITGNTITVNDVGVPTDYTIMLYGTDYTRIYDNYLYADRKTGSSSVLPGGPFDYIGINYP